MSPLCLWHCLPFVRRFRLKSLVHTVRNYDNIFKKFVLKVTVNKECVFSTFE